MNRPNFLVIMTDQQRADHLGCYGNGVVQTPHIDSIAARGIRFEHFYVACPICMPNRIVFMTGRMPSVNGSRHNGIPLDRDAVTFVDLLRHAGYCTALIGKCHLQNMTNKLVPKLPGLPTSLPEELSDASRERRVGSDYEAELTHSWHADPNRAFPTPYYGFDEVRLANGHGDQVQGHYTKWLCDRHPDPDSLRGWQNALPSSGLRAPQAWRTAVPEGLYPTSFVAEQTIQYLEDQAAGGREKPFFLHCSFPDPHHPFTPPGHYFDMYAPDQIPLPASFHEVGEQELPFLTELRRLAASGRSNTSGPVPFATTDGAAVQQMIALTYGMITMIDDGVGRILGTLRRLGLDEQTVVVFTSDHGDFMGDHGLMLKHGLHYEGVLHVPLLWADPADARPSVSPVLGGTIDIGTTILARAGLTPANGNQGFDIVACARAGKSPARFGLMVEEDELAVHLGSDKGLRTRTFLTPRWRLTLWDEMDQGEMFDREADPDELHNLWSSPEHGNKRAELIEMMLREKIRLGDAAPLTHFVA